MTVSVQRDFGISKQRGYWLRCFLEMATILVPIAISPRIEAQVDCVSPAKIYVSRVRGNAFDFMGAALPDAAITLTPEDSQPLQVKTDSAGRFDFKVPSGNYILSGELGPLEAKDIRLVVGKDLASAFRPKELKVILGLCWSYCSWATLNEREFRDIIRSNSKRIEEVAQQHATQK